MEPPTILKPLLCLLVLLPLFAFKCSQPAVHTVIGASSLPNAPAVNFEPLKATSTEPQHFTQEEIDQMLEGTNNSYDLKKLIQCESQNTNIARMDSNQKMSYGILQFQQSTWDGFAAIVKLSSSSPMNPVSAIAVADWMISHGELHRWTCAKLQSLF